MYSPCIFVLIFLYRYIKVYISILYIDITYIYMYINVVDMLFGAPLRRRAPGLQNCGRAAASGAPRSSSAARRAAAACGAVDGIPKTNHTVYLYLYHICIYRYRCRSISRNIDTDVDIDIKIETEIEIQIHEHGYGFRYIDRYTDTHLLQSAYVYLPINIHVFYV